MNENPGTDQPVVTNITPEAPPQVTEGEMKVGRPEQIRQQIAKVLEKYWQAYLAGNTGEMERTQHFIIKNPQLGELFQQQLQELRQREKREIQRLMEEQLRAIDRAKRNFFGPLADRPSDTHILQRGKSEQMESDLQRHVNSVKNAGTFFDLQEAIQRLPQWSDDFQAACFFGFNRAQEGARATRDRRTDHALLEKLDRERTDAQRLVRSIEEMRTGFMQARSRLSR